MSARGGTFPVMSKVEVNGDNQHPLFAWLQECAPSFPSSDIKWNFGKFLLNKDGQVHKRYAPTDNPLSIEDEIKRLL